MAEADQGVIGVLVVDDDAVGEGLPVTGRILADVDRIDSVPVFQLVAGSVRDSPQDSGRVDAARFAEIDDDPLRMKRVTFTGISYVQIGVALPEGAGIAIVEAGIAFVARLIEGIAAAGQPIAVR